MHYREGSNVSKVLDVLDFYENQHTQIAHDIQADIVLEENYDLDKAAKEIAEMSMGQKAVR